MSDPELLRLRLRDEVVGFGTGAGVRVTGSRGLGAMPAVAIAAAMSVNRPGVGSALVDEAADDTDAQAASAIGALRAVNRAYAFNGTAWDRLRTASLNADAVEGTTPGAAAAASFGFVWNGDAWDRMRSASPTTQASIDHVTPIPEGVVLSAAVSTVSAFNASGGSHVIVTLPAVADRRWIVTSFDAFVTVTPAGAAQVGIDVKIWTGGVRQMYLAIVSAAVSSTSRVALSGLSLAGDVGASVSLETFPGAAGVNHAGTLCGYLV